MDPQPYPSPTPGRGILLHLMTIPLPLCPQAGEEFYFIAANEGTKSHHGLTVSW